MLLLILLPLLSGSGAAAQPVWDPLNPAATDWLTRFGYLPPPDAVRGQLQMQEALTEAIKAMQRFAGLEISGVIDEATLSLMKTPRCSLPDVTDWDTGSRKRAVHPGTKWNKRNLSWRVRTFPRDPQLGHDTIRALMYYGLKVWSDVAPLNFHEVAGDNADILIDFSKAQHQDPYPFDGPGGAVAHAFFPGDGPGAGGVHFDDDEAWSFRSADEQVMDLFAVAVHEFGHAIGLPHSSSNVSIMRPYYQGPVGDPLQYHLPHHDQLSIWQMYGVRELLFPTSQTQTESSTDHPVLPAASPKPRPTAPVRADLPDRCNTDFDAVAQIRGEAFFFKGKYFWRLTRDRHLVSLQPAEIQRFWRGLPPNMGSVDSVYERTTDHKIVFFKGDRYWVFKDNNVEEGYPRFIADFGLSVTSVDVAFVSPHNDTTYLFKDNQYWRYDDHWRKMDPAYPKTTALWKGLPSGVDDAMRWSDGATYFFKGKEYWKVLGSNMEVDQSSPQPVGRDWLSCSQMQADSSIGERAESRPRSAPQPGHETGTGGERRNCTCGSGAVTARPAMRLMHEAILPLILLLALPLCLGTV